MRFEDRRGISRPLPDDNELLSKIPCRRQFVARAVEACETPQDRKQVRRFSEPLTQLVRLKVVRSLYSAIIPSHEFSRYPCQSNAEQLVARRSSLV